MKLFDEGKYQEAIGQYQKGKALDKSNSLFSYEIALSYFMLKDYQSCISTIDSVIAKPDANDQFYQLLGDAYDMTSQPDTALKIYNAGMIKFPKAANLSMESGVVEYTRKNYQAAHDYWIKGIGMNPSFADNYYHLSKFYADSSDRAPALIYAEIYLNLMRNTEQAAEISKMICGLYNKSIVISKDSNITVRLSDHGYHINPGGEDVSDFCSALDHTIFLAQEGIKGKKTVYETEAVIMFREAFVKAWFDQKFNLKFPFSLFDFEKQLLDSGYFQSYSQWLLMKCNVAGFQTWSRDNANQYKGFVDWYKKNPVIIKAIPKIELCK